MRAEDGGARKRRPTNFFQESENADPESQEAEADDDPTEGECSHTSGTLKRSKEVVVSK